MKCLLGMVLCALVPACASQPKPEPQSVAAPVVQPEPVSEPVEAVQEEADKTTVSPHLAALRDAVKNGGDIEKTAHDVIDANPESADAVEALRALAIHALAEKDSDKAQLYIEAAVGYAPQDVDNLYVYARVLHAAGRDDEAIKKLDDGIRIAPDNSALYRLKANILLEYLDTTRALEAARKAHEIAPENCGDTIVYADALYASKSYEDAVAAYESARVHCTVSELALQNLAKLYEVHVQNPEKACGIYKLLAEQSPDNAYYKASRDYQCGLQQGTEG